MINIKPLVNLTINKLGLLDEADEDSSQKADSPTNVLKSMFNIWYPEVGGESVSTIFECYQASAWASKKSKEFKAYVRSSGEFGDVGFKSEGKKKTEVWSS